MANATLRNPSRTTLSADTSNHLRLGINFPTNVQFCFKPQVRDYKHVKKPSETSNM